MDSDVGIESGRMYMILWKASESGFIIQIGSIKRFVTSAKKALILSLHPASCRTENDSFPPLELYPGGMRSFMTKVLAKQDKVSSNW